MNIKQKTKELQIAPQLNSFSMPIVCNYYLGVFIETQFPYVQTHRTAVRCGKKLHDQLSSTKDYNPGAVKINTMT